MIERKELLDRIVSKMWDGQVKVITGVRRCGKSYLLRTIFKEYLLASGTKPSSIIELALDSDENSQYRNPVLLGKYLRSKIKNDKNKYYFLIDEIQLAKEVDNPDCPGDKIGFSDVLIGLSSRKNCDVYVTGSNSKMLSNDIITQFRGKNDQIHIGPLSFSEYFPVSSQSEEKAFNEYLLYGGMPATVGMNAQNKEEYLINLFNETYLKDLVERHKIERIDLLENVLNIICATTSNLTNPTNIANSISSVTNERVCINTVTKFIGFLENAFLISEVKRYDVRGKHYFDYPNKYYFADNGLRNARLNFRQNDKGYLMENTVYNELIFRKYSVDIGVVYDNNRKQREIDFIAGKDGSKTYIQSAYQIESEKDEERELRPLEFTNDFFTKICLRNDLLKSYTDEKGVQNKSVIDFLLS
ncbi:MAG: ATP-binding protein [Sphaerochaetaceae bacterium]|nr:ATP-binding protein [Sphaerochaetaceae bacterium]